MKNKKITTIMFFLVVPSLIGCYNDRKESFYDYCAKEDLYRIPLINPYELTNVFTGILKDTLNPTFVFWQLNYKYNGDPNDRYHDTHVNVTHVNVFDSIIYGHGRGTTHPPNNWFVLIPKHRVEKIFPSESQWNVYLDSLGIKQKRLYQPWQVFKDFKQKLSLPWHKQ